MRELPNILEEMLHAYLYKALQTYSCCLKPIKIVQKATIHFEKNRIAYNISDLQNKTNKSFPHSKVMKCTLCTGATGCVYTSFILLVLGSADAQLS